GGILGLFVAMAGIRFLVTSPTVVPRLQDTTLNPAIVAFTMLLSLGCAIVFGLLPAVHAAGLDLQQTLRDGGRESAVSSRDRMRGVLVIGELCLTQVLLVGAGLLIRSAMLAEAVPPGFDPQNLLIASVMLPSANYADPGKLEAGFLRLDEAIAAIPGVRAVGRASLAPIYDRGWNCATMREGSNGHDEGSPVANMRSANESYFSAVGVPLLLVFLWRSTNRALYASVFLVVASLELYGTAIGTWRWAPRVPGLGISDGNPPSGVASGYVWFDVMALLFAPWALAAVRTWPLRRRPVPGTGQV
ncbi:MAG: hypothetical protein ACXVZK_14965, partial [Gaiellaceae bacterium]